VLRICAIVRLPARKRCIPYKGVGLHLKDRDCKHHSTVSSHRSLLLLCIQMTLLQSLNILHLAMPGM